MLNKDAEGIKCIVEKEGREFLLKIFYKTSLSNIENIFSLQQRLQELNKLENKQIPKVITKINKISYNDILTSLELSSIISPKLITTFKILRYIRSLNNALGLKVETLYKIINNQVEALEFLITEKSEFTNIPLKDLRLKPNILISAIIRGTNIIVPSGEDMILPHDRIIIVTTNMQLGNLNILG